jgi:hypothetical protein
MRVGPTLQVLNLLGVMPRFVPATLATSIALSFATIAGAAAPAQLTIGVADLDPLTLVGTLSTGDGGESILIDGKDCLSSTYRVVGGATTRPGGSWTWLGGGVQSRTTFRARWREAISERTVTVPRRIDVYISRRPGTRVFRVGVFGRLQNLHGRPVELQRFVAAEERWVRVGVARLRRGVADAFGANFVVRRPGLLLRAAVPRRTAAPCFLPNVSTALRS